MKPTTEWVLFCLRFELAYDSYLETFKLCYADGQIKTLDRYKIMNWDAIGAIGEVLGAIAVLVTLIYLAVQVRQNTLAIKGQSIATATLISQGELQAFMNTDAGVAYHKSIGSPESLSTHDIILLDAFNSMFLAGRENEFMQLQLGTMDEQIWFRIKGSITAIFSSPWGKHWWNTVGKGFASPEFCLVVDDILENPTFSMDDYYDRLKLK